MDQLLERELRTAAENATRWRQRRDQLIFEAHQHGGGLREIARIVDMSHPGVMRIIQQHPVLYGSATPEQIKAELEMGQKRRPRKVTDE